MMSHEAIKEQANKIISEVAEEVMLNIFGKKALNGIIRAMREKYLLDLSEMPERPYIFSEALRRIIGVGSVIVEDLIIENLHARVGLEFRWKKGYGLTEYINEIKNFIMQNKIQVTQMK